MVKALRSSLKGIENEIKELQKRVNEKMGVKESDTGLAPPNLWDLPPTVNVWARRSLCKSPAAQRSSKPTMARRKANPRQRATLPEAQLVVRVAVSEEWVGSALGGLGGSPPPTADEEDKYVINVSRSPSLSCR